MRKSKFTDVQVMAILYEVNSGGMVKEVCGRHGISEATYYGWKAKYGDMNSHAITKIKSLEHEIRNLRKQNAVLLNENLALKGVLEKKNLNALEKRTLVDYLISEHQLSIRRSCGIVKLSRNSYGNLSGQLKDSPLIEIVLSMVEQFPHYGFRKLYLEIRGAGYDWNHKRLYRIYCQLELNKRGLRNLSKDR